MARKRSTQENLDLNFEQRAKARAARRAERRKRERRRKILALGIIFLLIVLAFFYFKNSTSRQISKMTAAIKTNDTAYLSKNMDKMDEIIKTLGESYSEDEKEVEEFLASNFKNLTIEYVDTEKTDEGKEVSLDISNVNYIDTYDSLGANPSHKAYMDKLASEDSPQNKTSVKILIKKSLFRNQIYESRPFVNAILGGALDHTDNKDGI
ncbi:MAG: hypothetical protein SOU08_06110 [Anaerococcus sp.]|nr:hypothetical protein [Anaerococcus sp.]MDD7044607.1 hypothetical protein [Peptoniphilaceae bacterium]MDY2919192.1 hypothetical protein [Anaerococcus sp.]